MGSLRYDILTLISEYTKMGFGVPFSIIYKSIPSKSMKNVSNQLAFLKNKGFVATRDSKYNYSYIITPLGIQHLSQLNAKKRKAELTAILDMELQVYNSYMG